MKKFYPFYYTGQGLSTHPFPSAPPFYSRNLADFSSAMDYNGSGLVAMTGKNCVAIAAEKRLGADSITIATDFQKIFALNRSCYVGLPGLATDIQTFSALLRYKTNLYKLEENRDIRPRALSHLAANLLYEKRFSPYFVMPMVAGLEKNSEPFICNMDCVGCINSAEGFVVGGTASDQLYGICEALWEPDLEPEDLFEIISQALLNAVDRDNKSGWGAVVHVMCVSTPEATLTRTLKARQD
ncbi:uncharacterized protein VTP21DRAFT_7256 [Calcarisporiella thermophila]|uniref:uncharacterized protein n=1 Tax=Calcarisporiella thermophila TaxID=911321 RepID=UPI00374286CB